MVRGRQEFAERLSSIGLKNMKAFSEEIYPALMKLDQWVERADWKAYDTFDGLSSPLTPFFTWNIPWLKICWQQGVRRFPLNLRPLLGIKPGMSSKAMGFFAQGYLKLYQTHQDQRFLKKARFCLQWLMDNPCPGFQGCSWGNHFDYQHRAGSIPKGLPTIVWTGLIGHAFVDAYEILGEEQYLKIAQRVCKFIADEIGHSEFEDTIYLHYYPGATHQVHNSNMIGASILARVHQHIPNDAHLEMARKAVRFTMQHQLPNGSWYYGVGPKFKWVDSFHTGYVLEALDIFNRCSGGQEYAAQLEKGYRFYVETFFEPDGTPRYYDNKRSPLDIQCASQGIQTLLNLQRLHPGSVGMAEKVAHWTIKNMQDRAGFFYYRKYPLITNKTPTMHWGQATMFAALALFDQLSKAHSPQKPAAVGAVA
jgi:hypothetical protein